MNRTLREIKARRCHYSTHEQLWSTSESLPNAYNFARRPRTLRGRTTYEEIVKWWNKEPERFTITPDNRTLGPNMGQKNRSHGQPARSCRRKFIRDEDMEQQFADIVGQLRIDETVFDRLRGALLASHNDLRNEREKVVKRLHAESDLLQARFQQMYADKLDGRIDNDFFDQMAEKVVNEQARCRGEIERN